MPSLSGLSVTIKDVRNAGGNILVIVYDESNFGKTRAGESQTESQVNGGRDKFVFHNLPWFAEKLLEMCQPLG